MKLQVLLDNSDFMKYKIQFDYRYSLYRIISTAVSYMTRLIISHLIDSKKWFLRRPGVIKQSLISSCTTNLSMADLTLQ